MGEMQVFSNVKFGNVRSVDVNGEAWFVAADVCKALEHTNPTVAMSRLDDDEKAKLCLGLPGGDTNCVNEYGIYDLVLTSRKREAKEFKRWVKHEVLPSIRKHGMYATPQTMENMLNDPDFAIRLLEEIKKERQEKAVLAAKNGELEAKIEEDRPMTEFGLAISTSEGCISVAQLAAMLCQKGVDTGEHRLFAEMREDGFLNSSGMYYNKPAQRYLENKMMEYKVFKNKFNNKVTFQPLITPKGIQYFMDYYLRKHGKLTLLTVHRRTVIEKRPAAHSRQSKGGQVSFDEIGG